MKILALTNRLSALTKLFSVGNAQKTTSNLLKYGLILLSIVTLWGCGKSNGAAPAAIDPATGKHQLGWATVDQSGFPPHASAANGYFANPGSCVECHGQNLTGGISKVTCFNKSAGCHINIPFPHPVGYKDFKQHGADAKKDASGKYNGMANCKNCHGKNYRGVPSSGVDCIGCHRLTNPGTNAPHAANWRGGNANGLQHSVISPAIDTNAAACNDCHARGNNSTRKPNGPAQTTYPSCFTDTLCHARDVGHADPNWKSGTVHGANVKLQDAVATPANANAKGFKNCAQCHADNTLTPPRFKGGRNTTCENCHIQAGLAHPQTWVAGRGTTAGATNGTSTHAKGVAPDYSACTLCHGGLLTDRSVNGITYPSCLGYNLTGKAKDGITVCHFTAPVDIVGAGATFKDVGCKSCHYSPGGAYYPASTTHTKHLALTGVSCDTCHFSAGNGGATHADGKFNFPPPVNLSAVYNARSGTAVMNADKTCSQVSCHGGQTTQFAWSNPTAGKIYDPTVLDSSSCLNCHELSPGLGVPGVPQYNSFYSGKDPNGLSTLHARHTGVGINTIGGYSCLACHDTTKLSPTTHFGYLDTHSMKSPASATIGGNILEYIPITGECYTQSCHGGFIADNFPTPNLANRRWF